MFEGEEGEGKGKATRPQKIRKRRVQERGGGKPLLDLRRTFFFPFFCNLMMLLVCSADVVGSWCEERKEDFVGGEFDPAAEFIYIST